MSGITVPTLDQIKGSTVMTKLRCLVQKFIDFAQEVDDKIDEPLEQAQQAVTTANTASATANSASAAANIASENANNASTVATQAATTVAGYNARLTEAEDGVAENKANILTHDGEITTLQGKVNQLDGDITDITNDMTNMVRKVSNTVQNVNKGLTFGEIPDDGRAGVTKDYIDSYPHMVRTTGEKTITGPTKIAQLYTTGYPCIIERGQSFEGRYNEARQTIMAFIQPNDKPNTTSEYVARQFVFKGANTDETSMIFQLRGEINGEIKTGSLGITMSSTGRMIVYVTDADGTTRVLHG